MKSLTAFASSLVLMLAACAQDPTSVTPGALTSREVQAAVASSSVCATCVFGPQTYTRLTSAPRTETTMFSADPTASYIIDIDDGGSRGADGAVVLNGEVLLPYRTDADVGPRHVRIPIATLANNTLEVRLTGKPESWVMIQVIREGPVVPDVKLSNMTLTNPPAVMTYGGSSTIYYTGTVTNNSGAPVGTGYSPDNSQAVIQHWVVQGSAKLAAGGAVFSPCYAGGAFGVISIGACNFWNAAVSVGPWSGGTGTLTSGSATLLVELKLQRSAGPEIILDTYSFPITVVVP